MSYVDGFVLAVPTANKKKFLEHARIDSVFIECGALRVLECWGDDVSRGQQTDFFRAVDARTTRRWCSRGSNGRTRPPATPA
ncbi:hypothetical protein XTPLMG730_3751 [Xanthomonas translucens pv. phlei]|uniref:DUF1428 domain-containing protein n=1 Tax=Xanthomonas graminis pv. phlei TaxID=487906 RepID=A0A0K3A4M6_9XANT|nr:hypothetical protein XTPLMG730_3751 [Xanthomonas translucens pv. phlei]